MVIRMLGCLAAWPSAWGFGFPIETREGEEGHIGGVGDGVAVA